MKLPQPWGCLKKGMYNGIYTFKEVITTWPPELLHCAHPAPLCRVFMWYIYIQWRDFCHGNKCINCKNHFHTLNFSVFQGQQVTSWIRETSFQKCQLNFVFCLNGLDPLPPGMSMYIEIFKYLWPQINICIQILHCWT